MPRKRQHFGIALKSTGVLQHSVTECMGTAGSSKAGQETRREEKVKSTLYCGFRGKEWEQCGKQQLKCITWMTWVVSFCTRRGFWLSGTWQWGVQACGCAAPRERVKEPIRAGSGLANLHIES